MRIESLGLSELKSDEISEINGGCDGAGKCEMGYLASFLDGFAAGWNSAKAGWDSTVRALS